MKTLANVSGSEGLMVPLGHNSSAPRTALSPLIEVSGQLGKGRSASPRGESHWMVSVQACAASAEALQTGFDPFHFMQKTVELGQSQLCRKTTERHRVLDFRLCFQHGKRCSGATCLSWAGLDTVTLGSCFCTLQLGCVGFQAGILLMVTKPWESFPS